MAGIAQMAGIANYAQAAPARDYRNGGESSIFARPSLQLADERRIDDIADQVEGVFNVKKDNFQPKVDKRVSYLLTAATVALFVFGALAAGLLHATGIGAGIIAAGVAIGLIAWYLHSKADDKEKQMPEVALVAKDATRRRIEKAVQRGQDQDEGVQGHPVRGYRQAPVAPADNAQGNPANLW
jgi:hypothetical protein